MGGATPGQEVLFRTVACASQRRHLQIHAANQARTAAVADPTEIVRRQLEPRKLRRVSEGSQQVTVAQESRIGPDIDRKNDGGCVKTALCMATIFKSSAAT